MVYNNFVCQMDCTTIRFKYIGSLFNNQIDISVNYKTGFLFHWLRRNKKVLNAIFFQVKKMHKKTHKYTLTHFLTLCWIDKMVLSGWRTSHIKQDPLTHKMLSSGVNFSSTSFLYFPGQVIQSYQTFSQLQSMLALTGTNIKRIIEVSDGVTKQWRVSPRG